MQKSMQLLKKSKQSAKVVEIESLCYFFCGGVWGCVWGCGVCLGVCVCVCVCVCVSDSFKPTATLITCGYQKLRVVCRMQNYISTKLYICFAYFLESKSTATSVFMYTFTYFNDSWITWKNRSMDKLIRRWFHVLFPFLVVIFQTVIFGCPWQDAYH